MSKRAQMRLYGRNPAIREAAEMGWSVKWTGGNHVRLQCPAGCCTLITGGSPAQRGRASRKVRAGLAACPASGGES